MPWNALFPLVLLLLAPAILATGALISVRTSPARAWQIARATTLGSLTSAALLALLGITGHLSTVDGLLQAAPLTLIMLLLANGIGLVVVRYSCGYLAAEPREARFAALIQAVFAAVSVAVLSDHLALFLLAWSAIGLAMHQLLMFYPERPRAALAAHKKFLFARAAELCALAAFVLLIVHHDTAQISAITQHYLNASAPLSVSEQLAACLLVLTALIKCAQLPLHGWLIQVVEAPTPVSATLHGGVINLGGYMLLLFAPLIRLSPLAQGLLLVVAGISTVLAAWVMMTRVSVKVRLAWSTSAQMGLMLVEIALGLVELALLHLIAHSCYKAYAFLSAGEAVQQDLARRQAPGHRPTLMQWLSAAALSTLLVLGLVSLAEAFTDTALVSAWSPWVLLWLALAVLLAERNSSHSPVTGLRFSVMGALVVLAYIALKLTFSLAFPVLNQRPPLWADLWVSALFITLFAGYCLQRHGLHLKPVQTLNLYCYAGFYLDEWVTRVTLRCWPLALPSRPLHKQLVDTSCKEPS